MGMGADGHTASWFPGAQGLAEALDPASPRTVVALHAPQAFGAPDRISLTRAALSRVSDVLLLITGADKRSLLETALGGDERAKPVAALFANAARAPDVYWAP
jgi:6-phosphogluconolactonase